MPRDAERHAVEEWIARTALGDQAAFDALYAATSGRLYALCLSVLRSRAEADEALQDCYLRVWRGAGRYAVNGLSPMTWLLTIARNCAIDRRRAAGPALQPAPLDDAAALPAPGPSAEAAMLGREAASRLASCMAELDPARAEALRGVYLRGMSYAETAEAQGVPLNTIRSWLRRGLLTLRACVNR